MLNIVAVGLVCVSVSVLLKFHICSHSLLSLLKITYTHIFCVDFYSYEMTIMATLIMIMKNGTMIVKIGFHR